MIQLGQLYSQLLFQFAQIRDDYFEHHLLVNTPHISTFVINWIPIWHIWRPQLSWNKFWGSFSNNSMVAYASFTVV